MNIHKSPDITEDVIKKGAFYTQLIWSDVSKQYLAKCLTNRNV